MEIIKRAINDYAHIAKIRVREQNGVATCTFSRCRYENTKTVLEFSNYLIDLRNKGLIHGVDS